MARQLLALALVFFAIVGMASSATEAPAAAAAADATPTTAQGPSTDNAVIGNTEGSTDAAPVGGPVSPGTLTAVSPAQGPGGASAASSLKLSSAFAGAVFATVAGALVF